MKRKRLILCFVLSVLIHLAMLMGITAPLLPSPGMPTQRHVIPVHLVFMEAEERIYPYSGSLAVEGPELSEDSLIAKAERPVGTPGHPSLEDFPGPIPKEGTFESSLSVEHMPTTGVLPIGQAGEEVESKRIVSRSLSAPLELPPLAPSQSDQSPFFRAEESRVLTEADTSGVQTHAMTWEKTTAPLGRNRPHPDFVSELRPIPTVKSPSLPEKKEMILARHERTVESQIDDAASLRPLRVAKEPEKKIGESRWYSRVSGKAPPLEPLTTGFETTGTFVRPEEGYSMLLVIDTSGSVKGPPLKGIKKSAMEFISLLGEKDRCAVITFDDQTSLVVPFTSDKDRLRQEIIGLVTAGKNTVMFDALTRAFLLLKGERDRGRVVVVFSDGKDEGSQSSAGDVIEKARKTHISVFCVGHSQIEKEYLRTLEEIAKRTGGLFADAPQSGEIVELFRAARDLKNRRTSSSHPAG